MTSAEPSKLHSCWGSAPHPGIYRIEANLGEKGRGRRVAARSPILAPARGALVASRQSPILRPGRLQFSTETKEYTKNDSSAVVRSELLNATRDPSPLSQLVADPGCGGVSQKPASQHDALIGVAHWARNSQQINQRLPPPGRAARAKRERRLAKEWFGSNRALKRTIATSRSDDNQNESNPATSFKGTTISQKEGDHAKRYPYANCPMETALA